MTSQTSCCKMDDVPVIKFEESFMYYCTSIFVTSSNQKKRRGRDCVVIKDTNFFFQPNCDLFIVDKCKNSIP